MGSGSGNFKEEDGADPLETSLVDDSAVPGIFADFLLPLIRRVLAKDILDGNPSLDIGEFVRIWPIPRAVAKEKPDIFCSPPVSIEYAMDFIEVVDVFLLSCPIGGGFNDL